MSRLASIAVLTLGFALVSACEEEDVPDGGSSGIADAATADADAIEGGPGDGGSTDASIDAAFPDADMIDAGPPYQLQGTITYDWVEALDDVTQGGPRLDFPAITARPARRVVVQAIDEGSQSVAATASSNDEGRYSLDVPNGRRVFVRVLATSRASAYQPDGIAPDNCNGASWEVRAVDNTNQQAMYAMDGQTIYSAAASAVDLHAALVFQGVYLDRTAAPFALIDTVVSELELVCQGGPAGTFPLLNVNWSVNNVDVDGDITRGEIGTSFYDSEGGTSNLYILGRADVDTDEYDDHVVAHETGHYFEDRAYRADNLGGSHVDFDSLDPTVAFGEGYGNAVAGMTFNDPIYVDTSSAGSLSGGFTFSVDVPPEGDDRGIYSETSAQYFLWSLYENSDAAPRSGSFARLHEVLRNHQRTSDALTCLQTFAAYYNQVFGGTAEELRTLWADGLGTPYDSLCVNACAGTGDVADIFDVDNDIGMEYAGAGTSTIPRRYPQDTGAAYSPEFWQLYRPLVDGRNAATPHDQTAFGQYDEPENMIGAVRWYRSVGNGGPTTIGAIELGAESCAEDVLDMAVYRTGVELDADYSAGGCPTVTYLSRPNRTNVIVVYGLTSEVPSWVMEVSR